VRDTLHGAELEHAGAAFDRVQRAEQGGDDLRIAGAGIDVAFQTQQIGVDRLEQLIGFITKIRDEFGTIEEIVG
jgi:hypothetical protein